VIKKITGIGVLVRSLWCIITVFLKSNNALSAVVLTGGINVSAPEQGLIKTNRRQKPFFPFLVQRSYQAVVLPFPN
jgi:hypothetical protein